MQELRFFLIDEEGANMAEYVISKQYQYCLVVGKPKVDMMEYN